ncbi:MAG TPA: hypothetical protein VIY51_03770 [Xanthobacteraceae bacterium]
MTLHAPNIVVFVIAGCLAMMGVLAVLPISLPIPFLSIANAPWYIFLAWFLLAAGTALPRREEDRADSES